MVNLDDYSKNQSSYDLWPYKYYAETVEKITDGKPTSFGMDIIFTNTVDATGWPSLIDELSESYLAVNPYMVKIGDKTNPLEVSVHRDIIKELTIEKLPIVGSQDINHVEDIIYKTHPELQEVSSGMGFANIQPDPDGVLRRLPIVAELNGMLVPHLFFKLLCEHFSYQVGNIELASPYKLILRNFPNGDDVKTLEIPLDGYGNMLIN